MRPTGSGGYLTWLERLERLIQEPACVSFVLVNVVIYIYISEVVIGVYMWRLLVAHTAAHMFIDQHP